MPSHDVLLVTDLRRSWIATSPEVRTAIQAVTTGGWYIHGAEHAAFESELAAFLGVRHAAGVASGTDALVLAMLAVGCGTGSEIVTVANAGGYSSCAAAQIGARVVYADIEPTSLLMTPEGLARVLGPDTRAVVVTHLYGNIADVERIVEMCHPRGIKVIEDCAQAIGGTHHGRRAGSFGDVATFSFYPTKNLGAAGDGGAVATNDAEIDARARSLRQYGWSSRYRVGEGLGRNSRLDELQAAVLRIGLRHLDALNERRREVVGHYRRAVDGTDVQLVTGAGCDTVAHLAVVRVSDRARLRARFEADQVRTDVHYPIPDHLQEGLAAPVRRTDVAETEHSAGEIVTLPCFPEMTDDEIQRVCALLAPPRTRIA